MIGHLGTVAAVLLLLAPLISAAILFFRKDKRRGMWGLHFMACTLICYLLLILSVFLTSQHYEFELNKYDLDGDGSFSTEEFTADAEVAMDNWTSDTGRTLAPFIGLITCPLYAGFWHTLIGLPYLIFHRRKKQVSALDS